MLPPNAAIHRCGVVMIGEARTGELDLSASIATEALASAGHHVVQKRWVVDELSDIRYTLRELVDNPEVDMVLGIGGTGLDSTDFAPEALTPLITKSIPGFGELFRMLAFHEFGIGALQSRAQAAVCYDTLVYLVPSHPDAVRLAAHQIIIPHLGSVTSPELLRPTMLPQLRSAAE